MKRWLVPMFLACCSSLPGRASGFAALPVRGGTIDEQEARLVVAAHGERSTLWVEWVLRVTGDHFLVLVPLESEGTLDMADPAWFAAVEHATAPRVLPPVDVDLEACQAIGGVHDTTHLAHGERGFPRVVTTLTDAGALAAFLAAEGTAKEETVSFADFGEPAALVALEYPAISGAPMLVQLRLEAALAPGAWLERLQLMGRHTPIPATLTVLAPTPVLPDAEHLVTSEDLAPSWRAAHGDSNYPAARSRFLDDGSGAWVTEVVGSTHLFEPYYPDAQASVPSVVGDFYERIVERGYTCPDWSEWIDAAREQDAAAPVVCASGELASKGPPACSSASGAADALSCDGVADLSLALSGARLNQLVLTRHVGRLPTSSTLVPQATVPSHTVKLYAHALSESVCEDDGVEGAGGAAGETGDSGDSGGTGTGGGSDTAAASGGSPGIGGGFWTSGSTPSGIGGSGWGYGGSGATGPLWPDEDYPEDDVTVEVHTESCSSGSSSDSDAACSGDSSSDTEAGDDTCSGDSSSDTEAGDDTCSGDSSEGSGESCSGDGSADVEGDTCSGASEGGDATCAGGSGDCAVGRRGFPRPRLSVVTLCLAAGALPWRRRHRRKR